MDRYPSKLNNQQGFTLIEALIALFVLTVGILAMMTMQTTAIKGNANASSMSRASTVALAELEKIRHAKWNDVASWPTNWVDSETDFPVTVQVVTDANTRTVTVTVDRHNQMLGGTTPLTFTYVTVMDKFFGDQKN